MGVVTPTDFPIVAASSLVGRVPAGVEPLETILEGANWLYAEHRPPVAAFCPISPASDRGQSYVFPVMPSADALSYQLALGYYSTAGTWDLTVDHSADAATWTNTGISVSSQVSALGTDQIIWPATFELPSTARYMRVTTLHQSVTNTHQMQYIGVRPTRNLATAPTASGFIPFDDALHSGTTGGPVYVELLNRCRDNVLAVMRDRYQFVGGWLQKSPATGAYRLPRDTTSIQLFRFPFEMPANHDAQLTVRAHGVSGSGTVGQIIVGQVLGGSGSSVALALDDVHNTGTLRIQGARGEIFGMLDWVSGGRALTPSYVSVDWRPGD